MQSIARKLESTDDQMTFSQQELRDLHQALDEAVRLHNLHAVKAGKRAEPARALVNQALARRLMQLRARVAARLP